MIKFLESCTGMNIMRFKTHWKLPSEIVNTFCIFLPSYIWNFAFSETIYFLQTFAFVLSFTTLIATKDTHL